MILLPLGASGSLEVREAGVAGSKPLSCLGGNLEGVKQQLEGYRLHYPSILPTAIVALSKVLYP
jgi:hypothetical protein